LPPLRNPPLLETADDLATLSHLNEPSGAFLPSRPFLQPSLSV
jgi:myosin-5